MIGDPIRLRRSLLRLSLFCLAATCAHEPVRYHHARYGHPSDRVGRAVPTAEYASGLDHPGRDEWQEPGRVVDAISIRPGMRVADLGTGSGYFLPWLDRAVGARGRVVGTDIDEDLLALAARRVARDHLSRVELRTGEPDDPHLEDGAYDVVFVADTYHHVADPVRVPLFRRLRLALRPGTGRLVVVEWRDGDLEIGPSPGHKIPRDRVERELGQAGYRILREHSFLRFQYVLELGAR